jgi:hypothetical protein
MRRFLLHVLPRGFHRIRRYGLLASATRKANIARARELLAVSPPPEPIEAEEPRRSKRGSDEPETRWRLTRQVTFGPPLRLRDCPRIAPRTKCRSLSQQRWITEHRKQGAYDRAQANKHDEEFEKLCEAPIGTESVDDPEQNRPDDEVMRMPIASEITAASRFSIDD